MVAITLPTNAATSIGYRHSDGTLQFHLQNVLCAHEESNKSFPNTEDAELATGVCRKPYVRTTLPLGHYSRLRSAVAVEKKNRKAL